MSAEGAFALVDAGLAVLQCSAVVDFQQRNAAAQVIYREKAKQHADGSWHLTDGSRLDADVVYNAVGGRPSTAFLQPLGILDARGAIKVHKYEETSDIAVECTTR